MYSSLSPIIWRATKDGYPKSSILTTTTSEIINMVHKYKCTNRKLYGVWLNMVKRCNRASCKDYESYGGRGINVCDQWLNFDSFADDMQPTFVDGLKIDRIYNDGNYEPSNCRWVTQAIQSRNTRKIHKHNKSGFRGVHFSKTNKGFVAGIKVNNKKYYLGTHKTAMDAAIAYDTFVIVYGLEHTTNFNKGVFDERRNFRV